MESFLVGLAALAAPEAWKAVAWKAVAWAKDAAVALLAALLSLFTTRLEYVALVMFMVWADLVSGILRSRRQGDPLKAGRLAKTFWKVAEYVLLIAPCVAMANAFPDLFWGLGPISVFLVGLMELVSIVRNLDPAGAASLVGRYLLHLVGRRFFRDGRDPVGSWLAQKRMTDEQASESETGPGLGQAFEEFLDPGGGQADRPPGHSSGRPPGSGGG